MSTRQRVKPRTDIAVRKLRVARRALCEERTLVACVDFSNVEIIISFATGTKMP